MECKFPRVKPERKHILPFVYLCHKSSHVAAMAKATTTIAANLALDAAHTWQRAADLLRHMTGLGALIRVDGSLHFLRIRDLQIEVGSPLSGPQSKGRCGPGVYQGLGSGC